jgi:hypothetical protein
MEDCIMNKIESIEKFGKEAQGRKELVNHLEGGRLTARQMILSKCFECMGFYADGKVDCEMSDCPCYPLMPYRKSGAKYTSKTGKPMTDEHKAKVAAAFKSARERKLKDAL